MVHGQKTIWKRRSFWGFGLFLLLLIAWLRAPDLATNAAKRALLLCAQVIIPTLFPFFVLSNLFVRRNYYQYVSALLRPVMGPLFGLGAGGAGAVALGALGGYPIGAATAFDLYDQKQLTKPETERLLAFCSNAGPAYIFGVVGAGVLGSAGAGALVYGAHLLAAALVGVALHLTQRRPIPVAAAQACAAQEPTEPFSESFVVAVKNGLFTILTVCAFLCFFSVMLSFLTRSGLLTLPSALFGLLGLDRETGLALLYGAVELSTGVGALPSTCPPAALLSVCSFALGWGGLCVHCQVLAIKGARKLSLKPYFLGKLAQGLLAAVLVQLLARAAVGTAVGIAALTAVLFSVKILKKPSGKTVRNRV